MIESVVFAPPWVGRTMPPPAANVTSAVTALLPRISKFLFAIVYAARAAAVRAGRVRTGRPITALSAGFWVKYLVQLQSVHAAARGHEGVCRRWAGSGSPARS